MQLKAFRLSLLIVSFVELEQSKCCRGSIISAMVPLISKNTQADLAKKKKERMKHSTIELLQQLTAAVY